MGAMAGMALSRLAVDDMQGAVQIYDRMIPLVERQVGWFKAREVVESLRIQLAVYRGDPGAYELFETALALAEEGDVYGAIWLVTEVGGVLHALNPPGFQEVIARFADRPEVLDSPHLRAKFGVLKMDRAAAVDRT
jgi:hypothetical protein